MSARAYDYDLCAPKAGLDYAWSTTHYQSENQMVQLACLPTKLRGAVGGSMGAAAILVAVFPQQEEWQMLLRLACLPLCPHDVGVSLAAVSAAFVSLP